MSGTDSPLRLDLLAALQELTADDRTVLVLRYWEDLSVAQTADFLCITDAVDQVFADSTG